MKLYHWNSEAFRDWLSGDIFVLASSAKEARQKAMREFDEEYSNPVYAEKRREFEADLRARPDTQDVYFIHGSS